METDNAGAVQAIYNYGNDLISMNRAGVDSYYHYDGLGSVKQMTDSSETVVASYIYDAFGNSVASVSSVANPYGFTGEQQFAEADNLVFLRARYYKPSIGRFISRDPIGYKGGINLYVYVQNNPINFIDPFGLTCCEGSAPGIFGDLNAYLFGRERSLFPGEADPWDGGFRHCLGACTLVRRYGPFLGRILTDAWDACHEDIDDPMSVSDMIAERRGESIARGGGSCEEGCLFIYPPGHSRFPVWPPRGLEYY
jgi:RHS repeat-associated protein